jgi:hypothetical protein
MPTTNVYLEKNHFNLNSLGKTNSANYTGTELNINGAIETSLEVLNCLTPAGVEASFWANNGFVYRFGTEANFNLAKSYRSLI